MSAVYRQTQIPTDRRKMVVYMHLGTGMRFLEIQIGMGKYIV